MGLNVQNLYTFNGPFRHVDDLLTKSGVYLISILEGGVHTVLDIGELSDLHTRVKNHDRALQWTSHSKNLPIYVSSYYCDEPTRMAMESQLRTIFNPVCGVR